MTADRTEFLGRNGSVSAPAALGRVGLSGRVGPALDPAAAVMTDTVLAPGQATELVFVLGQAESPEQIRRLVAAYTAAGRAREVLAEVQQRWDHLLNAVQVKTPDPGMDLMLNRWLLYQVLACRVWARSAFYQSGGAYGFRDQLQDVMALACTAPEEARAQILRSAARQFEEGDVQHWWHPPTGIGVRTRITRRSLFPAPGRPPPRHRDRRHAVARRGGAVHQVAGAPRRPGGRLQPAGVSEQSGTVYEHCLRALEHGYRLGPHGLPLMGTGDWNDGMNRVGVEGKGESVWNGWFFVTVLNAFADAGRAAGPGSRCELGAGSEPRALRVALEANAWDGAWYRRAYFDDGTPLGSAQNEECQIDAIPQAWAVISGVADPVRARSAMDAVQERLVRGDDKLIQLFDPPFDKGALQPGYIKGYVPGIRENGGQYTHAATWVVLATALQGRRGPRPGTLEPDQPDPPRRDACASGALQGRAVRGLRRRVWRPAAHRPRRLDVVHRLGELAVPRRAGSHPRLPPGRQHPSPRSVHPARLAGIRDRLPPSVRDVPGPGGQPGRHRPRRPVGRAGRPATAGGAVPLGDDRKHHEVRVELG